MSYIPNFEPLTSAFGEQMVAENTSAFHVQLAYNLHEELVSTDTANSGTVTQSNNEAVVSTGTNAAGSATMSSVRSLRYLSGIGGEVKFQGRFSTGVANSRQEAGYGDDQDGFFFGYSGATFGLWRRKGGTDTFTAQASWNVDPMDGTGPSGQTLDPTKGNVYKIAFQWLGGGDIYYYIEAERGDGQRGFALVHVIEYAGLNTAVSIANPSLPIRIHAVNTGNTTDLKMYFASLSGFAQGRDNDPGFPRSYDASFSIGTSETIMFLIRIRSTFAGATNRVQALLTSVGASTFDNQANTLGVIRLVKNPTSLTGTPSWANINTNVSVAERDITASSRTGGIVMETLPFAANSSYKFDITGQDIVLVPGDIVAVVAQFTATTSCWAHLSWRELF